MGREAGGEGFGATVKGLSQFLSNPRQNQIEIGADLLIREAHDPEAQSLQYFTALRVIVGKVRCCSNAVALSRSRETFMRMPETLLELSPRRRNRRPPGIAEKKVETPRGSGGPAEHRRRCRRRPPIDLAERVAWHDIDSPQPLRRLVIRELPPGVL